MKLPLLFLLLCFTFTISAQDHGFPFGEVTYRELNMKVYEKDTSAVAVILSEFGEAYIDNSGDHNLIFEYHVKIKILKKEGLAYADVEIPLRKNPSGKEILRSVKASAFFVDGGSMRTVPLIQKNIFTENNSSYYDVKKFAIPAVVEGAVIEYQYVLESPFIYNFRNWEFQGDLPKMSSEYWATIPGNYVYNMTLKGFLQLAKNDSELIEKCFGIGGGMADCARYKYLMKDVPAFVEEDYMTARSNFLSALNFELSEIKYFDGRVNRVTKEWRDADQELRLDSKFGIQLKRGKDIEREIIPLLQGETDPLIRAKKIYYFIKDWYRWDDRYGMYSSQGIKKAFDEKKGNIGDINLSLIAALRFADLDVEPVILSTRNNGLPIELHPVLSDFNYVVAKVNIGDQFFLLDASDDFLPFGFIPERCLNGKGRVMGDKLSYWIELKEKVQSKKISMLTLKLDSTGIAAGSFRTTFTGYEAINERKRIASAASHEEYVKSFDDKFASVSVDTFSFENLMEVEKPLVQQLGITVEVFDRDADNFLFNPFVFGKWDKNPFRSNERLYPVDFATTFEHTFILMLSYSNTFEIVNLPDKVGIALPNAGGRYVVSAQNLGNQLSVSNSIAITKPLFSSSEYHYLKELFNRVIQVQNTELIFKRRR